MRGFYHRYQLINCSCGNTRINVPDVELGHDGGFFLEGERRMRKEGKEKEENFRIFKQRGGRW